MRARVVLLAVAASLPLAACATSHNPTVAAPSGASPTTTSASPAASAPTRSYAAAIGGSVSAQLGVEPTVKVPSTPPPSTLETKDIVVGTGAVATTADTVTVQYLGVSYSTGKPFDSSWSRGQPATFSLTQVVPGFAQGIAGMRVGGRREIVIPPALGYGAQGASPAIAPQETLVFVVDLLKIN